MREDLLQFIWQHQYFNSYQLISEQNEHVEIIHPGLYNTNQGPDFIEASIRINGLMLVGQIEIHYKSSDWYKHCHHRDHHFKNIILHVVWEHDKDIHINNIPISTLSLSNKVPKWLLSKYEALMKQNATIPCQHLFPKLSDIQWLSWQERLATERIEQKAITLLQYWEKNMRDWEEICWQTIAAAFGLKINQSLFLSTAKTIHWNILQKHQLYPIQIEALLMGQGNMLSQTYKDDYPIELWKEYQYLKKKYQLPLQPIQANYLRMYPASFPTLRFSQLSQFISKHQKLFSSFLECTSVQEIKSMLLVSTSTYWRNHYLFDKISESKNKQIGKKTIENIIINAIIPLVFAFGIHQENNAYKEKTIQWLTQMGAEQNTLTRQWEQLQVINHSAFDSQAFIQLSTQYCKHKKCLQCQIGKHILCKK